MRPNEQTQPSPAKLVSVILFARASKQFTIQTSIIYQKENYSYVLKFHDIFEFFIIYHFIIHRSSSASKNTKHEMSSVWLLHQPVICFKTKGFIKKLTAPYKNCQLEIGKIYVSSPAPRYLSRMS